MTQKRLTQEEVVARGRAWIYDSSTRTPIPVSDPQNWWICRRCGWHYKRIRFDGQPASSCRMCDEPSATALEPLP